MKKLTDKFAGSEGGFEDWYCETCAESITEPDWRYILDMKLSDFTDSHYVTCFNKGDEILGVPAAELRRLELENPEERDRILNEAIHSTRTFVLKATTDEWKGDLRLRISVVRQEPLDMAEEAKVGPPSFVIFECGCVETDENDRIVQEHVSADAWVSNIWILGTCHV